MKEKTCAIIGMGLLGSMHADKLSRYQNTKVIAVCDKVADKAQKWAADNNAAWYTSAEELFAAETPDVVVVATQDPYHKEPLIAACRAGVPYIICEKPLTTTVEDALEVKAAAEASGTVIKVLFPNRLFPLAQSVRLLLKEGFLGNPSYGELRMDDNISVPLNLWGADSKAYASASNPAYFLFSHAVDLLHFYLEPQRVKQVYAVGANSTVGSSPDYIDGYLTFDNGTIIRLKTEWTKRIDTQVENYMQLTATKGGFTFNKTAGFLKEEGLQIFIDGPRENCEKANALLAENGIKAQIKEYGDPIESYALEMHRSTPGNEFDWGSASSLYADSFGADEPALSPFTGLADGIEQVRVVEALLRSAKEGKIIML